MWAVWEMDGPTSTNGCHKLFEVKQGPSKRKCEPLSSSTPQVLPHGRDKAKKMLKMANGFDPHKTRSQEMGELASAARKNSRSVDYATHINLRGYKCGYLTLCPKVKNH